MGEGLKPEVVCVWVGVRVCDCPFHLFTPKFIQRNLDFNFSPKETSRVVGMAMNLAHGVRSVVSLGPWVEHNELLMRVSEKAPEREPRVDIFT